MNQLIKPIPETRAPEWERMLAVSGPLATNAQLVPVSYCKVVLAEPIQEACGLDRGSTLARMLVGSYPSREVNDPRAYALAAATVFADFPEDVGRVVVDRLIRRLKFLPTAADVQEACAEAAGENLRRRQSAERMLREHERRRVEADHDALVERDRQDPGTRRRLLRMAAQARTSLMAARPAPKTRPMARRKEEWLPSEAEADEHRQLYEKRMQEMAAAGLPTDPQHEGEAEDV